MGKIETAAQTLMLPQTEDWRMLAALETVEPRMRYSLERSLVDLPFAVYTAQSIAETIAWYLLFNENPRKFSLREAQRLDEVLRAPGGKVLVMRHGKPRLHEDLLHMTPEEQKVRGLQYPYSMAQLTGTSIGESVGNAFLLDVLLQRNGGKATKEASGNPRASDVARAHRTTVLHNPAWDCIEINELPIEQIFQIQGEGSKGAVPWRESVVDALTEPGRFQRIQRDVQDGIDRGLASGDVLEIITHTQQTNACDVLAGANPLRYDENGFRTFTGFPQHPGDPYPSESFEKGLFEQAAA